MAAVRPEAIGQEPRAPRLTQEVSEVHPEDVAAYVEAIILLIHAVRVERIHMRATEERLAQMNSQGECLEMAALRGMSRERVIRGREPISDERGDRHRIE